MVRSTLVATIATVALFAWADNTSAQSNAHLGHVASEWNDTPDNVGLYAAAKMEAEVAAQHAGLAANSEELARIKAHIGHVMHALQPESVDGGPGKGYGLIKAAAASARHISMAGSADDASDGVATHSTHVAASSTNVAQWAEAALDLAMQVQATDDLETAQQLAMQIDEATQNILNGVDANGDGRVSWQEGEGGLAQAETHLGLMSP